MIPAGYMAKRVRTRPEWIAAEQVVDIYSVSACISDNFVDYVRYWKHNGYWFFDGPEVIQQLARENAIDLDGTSLFYYEVDDHEFDEIEAAWADLPAELPFRTDVVIPPWKDLAGYDVVSFSLGTSPECSPLSCSRLAEEVEVNSHCLLTSLEQAQQLLEAGTFKNDEPGPYRIFAVYLVAWS